MATIFSIRSRDKLEEIEEQILAAYATKSAGANASRLHVEDEPLYRTNFQRDRDRIIHSRAFRRLKHKRQIFLITTGDHYRTRLTHTLEVSQLSRTIAKALGLNEDLTEAIALGHDLGHTPFGHIGEVILHQILQGEDLLDQRIPKLNLGGFKHNYQSVRVVDRLEKKYDFDGLNLTAAVREGILKHTRIDNSQISYPQWDGRLLLMNLPNASTLEGQVVAVCDEIAQRTHDLEDGLRAGSVTVEQIRALPIIQYVEEKTNIVRSQLKDDFFYINLIIKRLIHVLVTDVIESTLSNVEQFYRLNQRYAPFDTLIVTFSHQLNPLQKELDDFIWKGVIHRPGIRWADEMASYVIRSLFQAYLERPQEMRSYSAYKYFSQHPPSKSSSNSNQLQFEFYRSEKWDYLRLIADYIAGMTDSFAMREFERLVEK